MSFIPRAGPKSCRVIEPAASSAAEGAVVASVLDVLLLLATVLLGVALVLAAFGIVLLVCGLAVDFGLSCFLLCILLRVPAVATLLRLLGGQGST